MRKLIFTFTILAITYNYPSMAQDTAVEIPSLADVIGNMDTSEIAEMESSIGDTGSLSGDFDIAVDAAVDSAISEAIEEGLISAEEASDAAASLSIVASNAEFFDFDILEAIGEIVESGEFTMAEIRDTLEGFNSLSDAGKSVVGQESFDYILAKDTSNPSDPDHIAAKAQWDSLSAADQAVVESKMTAITVCRPFPGNPC